MLRRILSTGIIMLLVTIPFSEVSCGSGSNIYGTYVCWTSTTSSGNSLKWNVGDYLEIRKDGILYGSSGQGSSMIGDWKRDGDDIFLSFQVLGFKIAWKGRLSGHTLSVDDGSIWVNEASFINHGSPEDVVTGFFSNYFQGKYEEALSQYGPQSQKVALSIREKNKKIYPNREDSLIWEESLRAPAHEFGLNAIFLGIKSIKIISSKIDQSGIRAHVYFMCFLENNGSEDNEFILNKVNNVWQIGP